MIGIPITIHVVRKSSGLGGLTAPEVQTAVDRLNEAFAPVGIEFCHLMEVIEIHDTAFYIGIDTQAEIDALRAIGHVPGTINLYFTQGLADETGPKCEVSSMSDEVVQGIVIRNGCRKRSPSTGWPWQARHRTVGASASIWRLRCGKPELWQRRWQSCSNC